MLQRLLVQNYAIIDRLEIQFSPHLNIITGETGAGKSILLGALSLILGERADLGILFNKDQKCIIEGVFGIENRKDLKEFFSNNELDFESPTVIRREISTAGKSRAFINDTPVNLTQLTVFSQLLVDLHQQFDTLALQQAGFQLNVIDALANHQALLQQYQELYRQYVQQKNKLEQWRQQSAQFNRELDYYKYLFDELEEADFAPQEIESLDAELQVLNHVEEIKTTLSRVSYQLQEGEQPLVQLLKQLHAAMKTWETYHASLPELARRLHDAYIELQDIAGEVDHLNNQVYYDADRIEVINERLALGYKLLKKHGVQSTDQLLQAKAMLQDKLQQVLNLDEAIAQAEQQLQALLQQLQAKALLLSTNRKKQLIPFERQVNELLAQVGMPNAQIKVSLQQTELQETGQDKIEFLFDANRSNLFAPIRKVASGGELSRLMLCIKSLVAKSVQLPTLIFDEIDTGISGEAARQVGIIMKRLAQSHQVICITHQPQIAGKADAHYFVYKELLQEKLTTHIRLLSREERINIIAQMLSGEKPTAAALENAREMIGH